MNNRVARSWTHAAAFLSGLALSASAHAANDYALYLPFDGNLTDSSPNMNNGTATGACTFTAGETGQALSLDGTSCFVGFKSVINNQASWTWQAWVYPTSTGEIYGEGGPDVTFQIVAQANGTLALESWNAGYPGEWLGFNTPGVLPANQWTLVTLTLTGGGVGTGTVSIYINRSLVTQGAFQMESGSNAIYAGVGDNPGDHGGGQPSLYFGGKLEDLQIFQRALAPSEICDYPNLLCGTSCLPSTSCCTNADCPGPSSGTGTGMCSGVGGTCSIACGEGQVLCNGACIGATECCGDVCPPSSCIQNPVCDSNGHCTGEPVPDGTQCVLAGCPGVSACVSATCTCQIVSADMGGGSASSPDGGTSPIKRRSGCAIAGVAEGETGAGVSFLCLVFLALLVKRRALLRN